jgi:glycosyltransferase involved in cell wall biosynthesis
MTDLAAAIPHSFPNAAVCYAVSSVFFPGRDAVIAALTRKHIPLVLNQNGIHLPKTAGGSWKSLNEQMHANRKRAAFIIYQSQYCRWACEEFLGKLTTPYAILPNAVDTERYQPCSESPDRRMPRIFCLWGAGPRASRTLAAVDAFVYLKKSGPEFADLELFLPGYKSGSQPDTACRDTVNERLRRAGIDENSVTYHPPYSRLEAPHLLSSCTLLLHTQPLDFCPHLVSEALAAGLPVVFQQNGGTPELVGPDAGIGLNTAASFDSNAYPQPEELAAAMATILKDLGRFAHAARTRALTHLSLTTYLTEHRRIFENVCGT